MAPALHHTDRQSLDELMKNFRDLVQRARDDSMDLLNFVIGLHKELAVDIPETDYPRLATLDGCVDYLAARKELH